MSNKVSFDKKSVVFKEGELATKLYLVDSGEVLCLKSSKDRQIPVFLAQKGDVVGESAMLDTAPYSYSTVTLTHATLIEIPSENLRGVLENGPVWLAELSRVMIERFQKTANIVADNRIIHQSIIPEDAFPSSLEVEIKKILAQ